MARAESCLTRSGVLDAYFDSPPLLFLFILSTCCITVLDIPGFITRTAFWGNKVIQSGYDCFYFVSFVSFPPALGFFFSFSFFFRFLSFLYLAHSYSRSALL
ncbi:hypothetical protein ACN42_g5528 [Penicillium freii]|uniref:Uncharacterized protein n=1 Tax=Penicillium freii TaxID=48697 RepID=A0A101MJB2_PENFR|nr:hypothetical protein ACN42_g5528 [Penicillium freii]